MSSKDNVYRRHQFRGIGVSTANYFQFHRKCTLVMSKLDAMFIQDLFNRAAMAKVTADDYFLCTESFLQDEEMSMVWSKDEQRERLASLTRLGFVSIHHKGYQGLPRVRHIRIDIDAINEAIDAVEDGKTPRFSRKGGGSAINRGQNPAMAGSRAKAPDSSRAKSLPKNGILRIPKENQRRNSPLRFPGADAPSQRDSARQREDTPSLLVVNSATTDRESFLPPVADKKTSPSQWDMTTARKLYDALAAKNKVLRGWSKKKWANEFRLLRQFVPTERIELALQYLAANAAKIGLDEKFPPIHSARKFRDLFGWLEDRMKRDAAQAETPLTAEMKALADNLVRDYRWPKGSDKLVHEAVARSWTALAAFRKKLLPLFESGTKTNAPQHAQFAAKCVRHELIIDSFVQRWMKALHAELVKWEQWSGSRQSFLNRAVDTDGDAFHKWGRGLAAKWGNSKIWDKLIEEVK